MEQLLFDFSETLIDKDGDRVMVDPMCNTIGTIMFMLKCPKKKAVEVLNDLEKDWNVYSRPGQIILAKENKVAYNFEYGGETWYRGHKYNPVNEWDFRNFIDGKKIKSEIKRKPPKKIVITCTEKQIKRAQQLYYASSIGFNIGRKDYQRFYLM